MSNADIIYFVLKKGFQWQRKWRQKSVLSVAEYGYHIKERNSLLESQVCGGIQSESRR
jgi:hypothetical protein